jgi:seryl-tRNA synthetase
MLDLKFVRENPDVVAKAMKDKGEEGQLQEFLALEAVRRDRIYQVEQLKQQRNAVSEEVARSKKAGQEAADLIGAMRRVAADIKVLDEELRRLEEEMAGMLLNFPNIPLEGVPVGHSEAENLPVRHVGALPRFAFTPRAHWDLGRDLGILDFEGAGKVTGSRFAFLMGAGARLERALINFMLDLHTEKHGYQEVFPPFMVHRHSMVGTGQLPKFEEDAFRVQGTDYYLIPTAEVPVTNLHREEILDGDRLPLYYAAYSACFRAEAGAHGRDTRGLIRQHQFNKVELVKFCRPEDSPGELEALVRDAEEVLRLLNLPYRVVLMCTGDLGFAAAKKYDLEVWLPSYQMYREISSCSNFWDFQARRAGIRYRPGPGEKARFVHTLNGSGLAVGRTVAAILENYQEADGSVRLPDALKPYMGGLDKLERR